MSNKYTFNMPLFPCKISLYRIQEDFIKACPECKDLTKSVGLVSGSEVWVGQCDINTIAHEAYHLTMNVLGHVSVSTKDEEVVAYCLGYLTDKLKRFYIDAE